MTDRNRFSWLLVPSPLLGASTWYPVADQMKRGHGCEVVLADPAPTKTGDRDHLGPWASRIAEQAEAAHRPLMVVAHGAGVPRLPWLCHSLLIRGFDVAGMVAVDGRFPTGGLAPTEAVPQYGGLLDELTRPDGYLPPWPRWWGTLADDLVPAAVRRRLLVDAPLVPRAVFDQVIPEVELPERFLRHYLAYGHGYADALDAAEQAGWRTARLDGEHLHQLVAPRLVADALVESSAQPTG